MQAEKRQSDLPYIFLPEKYNYVASFLTMACNLRCSYCINSFGRKQRANKTFHKSMRGGDWVKGLNRLSLPPDIPITFQGGEPSLHPDFYEIIDGIDPSLNIDILTNLQFDIREFMKRVPPERIKRDALYASIRVSYHPEVMKLGEIKRKVLIMLQKGYSVGIWAVLHPSRIEEIERAYAECTKDGIDFRIKEFLGVYQDKIYGVYKYPDAVTHQTYQCVKCKTTELLISPTGHIFRCHSDLYGGRSPMGHLCDEDLAIESIYRPCDSYGSCNPCDVKIKTNRFQIFGHTSVDIVFQ